MKLRKFWPFIAAHVEPKRPKLETDPELEARQLSAARALPKNSIKPLLRQRLSDAVRDGDRELAKELTRQAVAEKR